KVMFTTGETHRFAPVECPDRHLFVRHAPVEDTASIGNRAAWFESTLGTSVFLVAVNHLAAAAHRCLRGQSVVFTHRVIRQAVNGNAGKDVRFPRLLANPVASSIGAFQCLAQCAILVDSRNQFHNSSQFHTVSIAYSFAYFKVLKGEFQPSSPA